MKIEGHRKEEPINSQTASYRRDILKVLSPFHTTRDIYGLAIKGNYNHYIAVKHKKDRYQILLSITLLFTAYRESTSMSLDEGATFYFRTKQL